MKADFAGVVRARPGGLELIAGGEEEADDEAGEQSAAVDVTELAVVHDGQGDEGEGHAEQIEEERGGVLKSVFDEDEGCAPDEDDCQQQDVGYGCRG